MNKNPMIELTLTNNTDLISPTAKYISKLFLESGTSTENKVCFAIEAFLEYRMSENKNNKKIKIKVFDGTNHFYVQIIDKGIPYVLSEFGKKILDNGLVDSYSIARLGKDGQQITLSFRYTYEHKDSFQPVIVDEELLDDEFNCRLLTDDEIDILEAIKCIYSAYEYDYLHTDLYYFDAMKRKLNSGSYYAFVCENKHHQIVGHVALSNGILLPDIPEVCTAVIKPAARGKGIATMLLDFAQEFAKKQKYNGVTVCPVVFHPFSQKICNKRGFVPCAINVSHATAESRSAAFMNGDVRSNEAITIKLFDDTKNHKIYIPKKYNSFISDVFEKLGSKYDIENEYKEKYIATTEYNSIVQKINEVLYISITKVGKDFEERIKELIAPIGEIEFEMVGIYLNVSIPTPQFAFDTLMKYGFKFNGFVPGSSNGDFIYFQKLKKPYPMETLILEDNFKIMSDKLLKLQD